MIIGFAGAERGIRGRVKAFDAKDGTLVWTFYTIPGPGELGPRDVAARQRRLAARRRVRLADAGRRPRARPHLLLHRQPGPRLQRRCAQRRQPVLRRRSSRSRRRPANTAGTSSRCITTSGTTTGRRRVVLFDLTVRRRAAQGHRRSRARPAGSTSSTARPASRWSASTRSRCRRSRARRPPRRSPTRAATRSCRNRSRSRPKASTLVNGGTHLHAVLDDSRRS